MASLFLDIYKNPLFSGPNVSAVLRFYSVFFLLGGILICLFLEGEF
jgi:hypothetical protein